MNKSVFELKSVSVSHGEQPVLSQLNVQLKAGQWCCMVGPNGVGKSTLLRAMAGLHPVQGELRFEGQVLADGHVAQRAKRLAWMGQATDDDTEWTVDELAMLGRLPHLKGWRLTGPEDRKVVDQVLTELGLLTLANRRLASLSAGQRQRARLARLLSTQAPVLLMDEPVTHLDAPHQADWLNWAKTWARHGKPLMQHEQMIGRSFARVASRALHSPRLALRRAHPGGHRTGIGAAHSVGPRRGAVVERVAALILNGLG
jgi:iron complex transport system ATP-binding protein